METAPPTRDEPRASYLERVAHNEQLRDQARAASLKISTLRAVTFVGTAAALVVADITSGAAEVVSVVVAAVLAVVFVVLIARHRRVRREQEWRETLRVLSAEALLRLDRHWTELAESLSNAPQTSRPVAPDHAYARDLDVEGKASLTRLMGPVTTAFGRGTLQGWLMEPALPADARARSEAARELAPLLDDRHELAAHGRLAVSPDATSLDVFLRWAEGEPWVAQHRGLRVAAWILPAVLVVTILLHVFGVVPGLWVIPAVLQGVLLKKFQAKLSTDLQRVAFMGPALAAYVPQLETVAGWPREAPALRGLSRRFGDGSDVAHLRLSRLTRLVDTVDSRRNMVYATFAPVFLLDVHLCDRLDRWRQVDGPHVRDWLKALGEMEALAALGSLAHDHPDWTFPTWNEGGEVIVRGTALGHPLLPPSECVRNDVSVGPPGTFLFVTGSNMSGKSTLLRAIGANVVLAGAGAPVCAAGMELPPVRVRTSMLIEDSLSEGISLFMAELLRVRDIVQAAEEEGLPVLYLLDEILHGTNTAERRIAARAVIRHLVDHGAIGAVSTHDLTLAEAPDLTPHAQNVHFREQVDRVDGRTRLSFDYLLRPGIATTRNALRLLEAVGLKLDLRDEE